MRCISIALATIALPIAASAGCWDYTEHPDPAPRATICYKDVCDETTQDYICGNALDVRAGYAIGWSFICEVPQSDQQGDCTYYWQGRPIDPAKNEFITITDFD